MKLSKLIAALTKTLAEHGDLEVFDCNHYPECRISVQSNEGLPASWKMPEQFLMIGEEL